MFDREEPAGGAAAGQWARDRVKHNMPWAGMEPHLSVELCITPANEYQQSKLPLFIWILASE